MNRPFVAALVAAGLGIGAWAAPALPAGLAGFLLVMLAPGAALATATGLGRGRIAMAIAASALSPLIVAALSGAALATGASPEQLRVVLLAVGAFAATLWLARANASPPPPGEVTTPGAVRWLIAFCAVLVVATGLLPQLSEAWRIRGDGWFHAAVVAELRRGGAPPADPYFAGFELQYMWLYHAAVLGLGEALHLDAFRVMSLLNAQLLVALILIVYRTSLQLSADPHRALAAAMMVPLGLSAVFWAALPLRAGRAFFGDVTGVDELVHQLTLRSWSFRDVADYVRVFANPEYFLDKYMIATAFGPALTYFALSWLALAQFHRTGEKTSLAMMFAAIAGALVFHPVAAFAAIAAVCGGAVVLVLLSGLRGSVSIRSLAPAGAALVALALLWPYLAPLISHRDSGTVSPIRVTPIKLAGFAIGCAAVALLAWPRRREFWPLEDSPRTAFAATSAVMILASILMNLPASNAFDKPPYFAYYPIAIAAGWTLAHWWNHSRRTRAIVVAALLWLPINGMQIASAWIGPPPSRLLPGDDVLASRVRSDTPADAVFIAEDNDIGLLVTGPRRLLFGYKAYAFLWGYDGDEMARRHHATRQITNAEHPDGLTLSLLRDFPAPLYVLLRGDSADARARRLDRLVPGVLARSFAWSGGVVLKVDPEGAARAANHAPPAPLPDELRNKLGY